MSVGLLGRKIGMTQVYTGDGILEPVTVIEAGPCVVLQIRSMERDGYDAVQLGFADKARGKATKAERGHVAALDSRRRKAGTATAPKANCEAKRWIREFRCQDAGHGLKVGDVLQPSSLEGINFVDVVGVTRGRGFSGAMRRHNFHGQPASHGAKRVHRKPGSIGASADPSRVFPGTRMAGHYGSEQVTVRNLRVIRLDNETNVVLVRGAIPGPNGAFVMIRRSRKG